MLELASGSNPYRGMTLSRIMYAMKNEKAPRIKNKDNRYSANLINFVNDRCLVKNPVERADTYELLMHPFMKDADDEAHKDAYLYFITDYFNCSRIQIRANKFDMTN